MTKSSLARLSEVLYVELAPFGLSTLHVSAGCVRTNVATNALDALRLQPDSCYGAWRDTIAERIGYSQRPHAIPTEHFVRYLVGEVLQKRPPRRITYGGLRWLSTLAGWWPWQCWVITLMGGLWRVSRSERQPERRLEGDKCSVFRGYEVMSSDMR
ncbi:uncharacterized protein C8Q71DRAFT_856918 [Rhodofomes roseus]|uniref:Uncharacterized protein n=1 Tax=Rhodofomes roseus TaxID=34475 RepID=A0ABQ8KIA1_9APHY|nr:uncharacterized protein C8Q71DRAFT_856918 [Rhodofomes roseus]KAH9837725.1 hypothetical protein C8Q71DRAFT_856918 [Rhodofomes roseus]